MSCHKSTDASSLSYTLSNTVLLKYSILISPQNSEACFIHYRCIRSPYAGEAKKLSFIFQLNYFDEFL